MTDQTPPADGKDVLESIRLMCSRSMGVLDRKFLCQSVSAMDPPEPICVREGDSLRTVIQALQRHRIGCVLVVDTTGRLTGIFSERDVVLKIVGTNLDLDETPVSAVMTPDPVAQPPHVTTAYALNLMSHGGFRHLPLVDGDHVPIGVISVKNIIDFLVKRLTEDLLEF